MTESIILKFEHRNQDRNIEFELLSKFTCINGKNSGEGKSEFLIELEQGIQLGEISCNLGDYFAIADAGSINALLQLPHRTVLMIDETVALQSEVQEKMQQSKHVFVCITRAMGLHFDYHMKGIYHIYRTDDWFLVERAKPLPMLEEHRLSILDDAVTESRKLRSEHQMLSEIGFQNITAACGRDEIEKKLRNTKGDIIVFADLSAIGKAYRLLMKRCQQNENIRFYNYDSFEQLICSSTLFKQKSEKSRLDSFSFLTLERYYEKVLEEITAGTDFQYEHGKPLSKAYSAHWHELLESESGKALKELIKR